MSATPMSATPADATPADASAADRAAGDVDPGGGTGVDASDIDAVVISPVQDRDGTVRVAVKDCIAVAGVVRSSGSAAVAATRPPSEEDADVVRLVEAAGGRVVASTNQDELCFGATGVNPHFGTPANPLDPTRIPGGSSSGSAVAVATGWVDVALGTDTTGSARTPAAWCGVLGLKVSNESVSLRGVQPLAPTLDCAGVLAASLRWLRWGARALGCPEHDGPASGIPRLLRLRVPGADPALADAVDAALERAGAGIEVVEADVARPDLASRWENAATAARAILFDEAPRALAPLVGDRLAELGPDVRRRFEMAAATEPSHVLDARAERIRWRSTLHEVLAGRSDAGHVDAIVAEATLQQPPPITARSPEPNAAASPANLAGLPALVAPIPLAGRAASGTALRGSIHLVGPPLGELLLCDLVERWFPAPT